MPERIQLRRIAGWRLPPNTVKVSRPSSWGNRWRAERRPGGWSCVEIKTGQVIEARDKADALDLALSHYRTWVAQWPEVIRADLRGKNLACWCALDQPCHADILLEIANA